MLTFAIMLTAMVPTADLPDVGVNLNRIGHWQPEYPFSNLAKMTPGWTSYNGQVWNDGRSIPLTATGFPAQLQANQSGRGRVYTQNTGNYDLGQYNLSWEGTGAVRLRSQGPSVAATSIEANSAVYDVLSTNASGILVDIDATDPNDPVRNIQLTKAGAQGLFNPQFLETANGFGVLRMLDWQNVNNSSERNWIDRTTLDEASWYTVPYEMQIETANAVNADLWLTIPHMATDDYATQLATLVRDNLKPELRVWVENSNEAWNGLFSAKNFYGSTAGYGQRSNEVFEIFNSVMGDDKTVNVISGQSAAPSVLSSALNNAPLAEAGGINAYFKLTAAEYQDVYADFVAGTATKQQVFDLLRADIDEVALQWEANKAVTDQNEVPLIAYEAGVNLTMPQSLRGDRSFVDFVTSLHTDERMADLYEYHYSRWQEHGETLMYYSLAGKWDAGGGLGLVQQYEDDNPKWDFVRSLIGQDVQSDRPGDANRDGIFGTEDLVQVFAAGEYEDDLTCNSVWETGDWNNDCEFTSGDLIAALQAGPVDGQVAATAAEAVPEPASGTMLVLGMFAGIGALRRRRRG